MNYSDMGNVLKLMMHKLNFLGPVVQNFASLTSSLRPQLVK